MWCQILCTYGVNILHMWCQHFTHLVSILYTCGVNTLHMGCPYFTHLVSIFSVQQCKNHGGHNDQIHRENPEEEVIQLDRYFLPRERHNSSLPSISVSSCDVIRAIPQTRKVHELFPRRQCGFWAWLKRHNFGFAVRNRVHLVVVMFVLLATCTEFTKWNETSREEGVVKGRDGFVTWFVVQVQNPCGQKRRQATHAQHHSQVDL